MAFDPETIAIELDGVAREARPVELLTTRYPSLTWEDARAVACATDRLKRDRGAKLIGYKLGWTSVQMGDPGAAVAWLVEALAAEGLRLEAGSIVFTGGLTAPFDVSPGGRFSLESPALAAISLISQGRASIEGAS